MVVVLITLLVILNFGGNKEMDKEKVTTEALKLYNQKKSEGMDFNSQCLGTIEVDKEEYAVDIVHVPRTEEDNKPENQCKAYRSGEAKHFIELDKDGNIVRII